MNKPILIFLLFFVSLSYSQVVNENCTTIYLIRHAEKVRNNPENKNPNLNNKGILRANKWKEVLRHVKFDKILSTDYFRTKETAKPMLFGTQKLIIYNPSSINYNDFMELNKGKIVLVVGHSNTIPDFSNKILEKDIYKNIEDNNNSDLYFINKCDGNTTSHALYYVN